MKNRIRIVAAAGALLLTAAPVYAQESTEVYEITAEVNAEESEAIQSGQPEQTETGAEKKTNGNAVGVAEQTEKADAGVTEQPEEEPTGAWQSAWEDGAAGFVERLYRIVLERPSDAAGKADWIRLLKSGEASGSEVAAGFFTSSEYQKSGKMDAAYVEDLYQAILGRTYDEAGKQSWISLLESGVSRTGILSGFTGSQEFMGLCRSYGITCGNFVSEEPRDQNAKVTAFVQRLYREVLGRDGDVNGLNDWTRLLLNGEATGAELAADFIGSPEYREKETENASFVEMLYRTMLNRSSDPEGKAHWCSQLEEGCSRYEILKGFIFSEEFGRLCEEYGIERGTRVPGIGEESTADAVARIAAAEIGYRETGNNRTKYNQWMYGYDASAPWCSIFICWCVNEAGAGDSIQNTAIASGYRVSNMGSNPFSAPAYAFSSVEPQPGDIVFIDNTGNGVSNHTGLIVDVDEDYIYTAEGNYSDKVSSCRYRRSNGYQVFGSGSSSGVHIVFYVRPDYQR